MAINKENIKLFASQRLTDEDDGGGRCTGNVVADGQVNNLFRDIGRIDRTDGDVSMRKVFVGVGTDNADPGKKHESPHHHWPQASLNIGAPAITWLKYSVLMADRLIFRLIPPLNVFSFFRRFSAMCLNPARISAPSSRRIRQSSSDIATSRT